MSNHWNEPKICTGCEIDPCTDNYLECIQNVEDSRADYEYEKKRDEQC